MAPSVIAAQAASSALRARVAVRMLNAVIASSFAVMRSVAVREGDLRRFARLSVCPRTPRLIYAQGVGPLFIIVHYQYAPRALGRS